MLSSFIYFGLSIFDALAMFGLIISLYKLPLWDHRYKVALFVIFIALYSFIMRLVIGLPQLDLPLQYLFFIIFLKYVYKLKFNLSAFVAGAGISAYMVLQLTIYYIYNLVGVLYNSVFNQTDGVPVYIIQISSILAAYGIAIFLKAFRLGFSFIRSHHESSTDSYPGENKSLLVAATISSVTIFLVGFFLYTVDSLGFIIMAFVTFSISYFLSQRSDYEGVRSIVEAYLKENKAK
ncbi:hypothetical protein [Paenibacillus sp. J22TS3]|uniref:hypothetical protein n=1 Tax=Paenibacillus sp. J22TS3 TaxID=2807192 RepID=UPI001AFF53D6|nr:hypothetical protein [Paenibacillus sp. J22TS3]GIP21359.1 hypothetical protein J22TS3_16340 [Paenibacillus sp. J22TS3]